MGGRFDEDFEARRLPRLLVSGRISGNFWLSEGLFQIGMCRRGKGSALSQGYLHFHDPVTLWDLERNLLANFYVQDDVYV